MDFQLVILLSAFIALLGGIWKISRDLKRDMDESIRLLFKRFDEHKKATDEKLLVQAKLDGDIYMRKDNCSLSQQLHVAAIADLRKAIETLSNKIDELMKER